MSAATTASLYAKCNCLALRQAVRHLTQFYDRRLTPSGLRTTQFAILAKLGALGPMTINALARHLVMDRTTLGRTMLPLERDGLISIERGTRDRRRRELALTRTGAERVRRGARLWLNAQAEFEQKFGARRAAELRSLLSEVVACDLGVSHSPEKLRGQTRGRGTPQRSPGGRPPA